MYRVIFEHHPIEGQEEQFIATWQKGSDAIQEYNGAQGTWLFRSENDPKTFYAMADWASKEERDAAMAEIDKRSDGHEILKGHERFLVEYKVLVSADLVAISKKDAER